MKYLKIDSLDPQGIFGFTSDSDKIKENIETIKQLRDVIEERKSKVKTVFCSMPYGRWIIVYDGDLVNRGNDVMHLFDHKISADSIPNADIFTEKQLSQIIYLLDEYKKDFRSEMDIVELIIAGPLETIQSKNIYSCMDNQTVLSKAEELGVKIGLQSAQTGDTIKVVLSEEHQEYKGNKIINLFAFMNFIGNKDDSGYGYIKLFNAREDEKNLQVFENMLFKSGLKFDRAYYSSRFFKDQLN